MEDNQQVGPKIFMTSDVCGALDNALAVGVSHHLRPFCTSGCVYHGYRNGLVLADSIRFEYAY